VCRSCSKGRRGCTKNRFLGALLARVFGAHLSLAVGGVPSPPTAAAFAYAHALIIHRAHALIIHYAHALIIHRAHALIIHWVKLRRQGSLVAV
jgi:hypothetical protein